MVQYWDEVGAYLDFTNPDTIDWWKARVKDALLKYGIAATWNDNNEFEIWSPDAIARGFGKAFPALQAKVLQTHLMMQASHSAQREHSPGRRPFLVTRSGGVGMHRYVQTWSGDNYTSWETLRFNLKMGLGLAMSGVSNSGHDIGGFSGPAPGPELFARWVAFGIFLPRFSIHSWNDDGTVNEPWMYPEVTQHVADLIKLRYRLIPYLYELLWQSHNAYEPVLRPLFGEFPHDPRCLADGDDMMLGSSMLVAPVVDAGQSTRDVYLPAGTRWVSYWSGEAFDGGQSVTLPAPFEKPVFLLREGSVVPLNIAEQHFGRPADERAFIAVPARRRGHRARHLRRGRRRKRSVAQRRTGPLERHRHGRCAHVARVCRTRRMDTAAAGASPRFRADGRHPSGRMHERLACRRSQRRRLALPDDFPVPLNTRTRNTGLTDGISLAIQSGDQSSMNAFKRARTPAFVLWCLPLAGAAISTGASAQSSVTLYGVVDNALTYVSNQKGHSNVYMSQGNLQASKFGLLGSEDLGGGTKAIFRLESGFNSLTGAQSSAGYMFNRQAYVGLSNEHYGTVTLGRQYTPYFQMVGALGPTGVLTGATGAHPGDLDALDTTLRLNNSIVYLSPTISGLQMSAQYGLGGTPGSVANGSHFSAALRYDYKPFAIAAGYVKLKDIATSAALGSFAINSPVNNGYATARSAQLFAAAARYSWQDLMVGINYSNVQYAPGHDSLFASEAVFNTYGLISTYRTTPSVMVGGGYSNTQASKANGITDPARYHQISLEQTYNLSSRTTVYLLEAYQHASGKTLVSTGTGVTEITDAVAVVGDSQNTTPSSGPSQVVRMVGLRHAF